MENQFDSIMERIRVRQGEVTGKENETEAASTVKIEEVTSPTKVFGNSSNTPNTKTPVVFRQPEPKETSPDPSNTTENESTASGNKKNRFSMLAAELDDYEFDYTSQYNKPKEAYMKGPSPRISTGLRTAIPSKSAPIISDFEARRIKFAQPIVNVNYLPNVSFSASSHDMSTVLGGSAEMMNVTTSSLSCGELSMNQQITHENTVINAQSCDNREAILRERNASADEYGAHTFMRKKAPKEKTIDEKPIGTSGTTGTTSTTSTASAGAPQTFSRPPIHALISSPKPFSKEIGKSVFSPVHFTPKSTSSPKMTIQPEAVVVMSPSKSAALEGELAKTRRAQFEQKFQNKTNISVPTPSVPVPTPRHAGITATPHVHVAPHQKDLFATRKAENAHAPAPVPVPVVQTQWRGKGNTPVVQGARAADKTAGEDVRGAGVGRLKNLKSRWEFSSATGTPIHPDATEDSLIATAIKMKESTIPNKLQIGHRSMTGRKGPSESSINSQPRSTTASPAAKNTRYGQRKNEHQEEEEEFEDEVFDDPPMSPEHNDDDGEAIEDEFSGDEIPSTDTSRFIDNAFGFIEGPGTGTPSPFRPSDGQAPLARLEGFSSGRRGRKELQLESDVIEEEDVPVGEGETDEEEEVTEMGDRTQTGTDRVETTATIGEHEKEVEKGNSSLPYSVSFYRKIQRERVGDAASTTPTPISPSAPIASLTSPQKLRQLTSGVGAVPPGGRVLESERETRDRLLKAMRVEEELITQSKRAMAFSREKPNFRGSREEFEAQWALLVHGEKHRALVAEYERLKREGPRIVDGPRGTITVVQLTVHMARDYVAAHIAASKKPDVPDEVFYFVAVLRYGEQVDVSKMVTSDGGLNRKGILEFPVPLQLHAIPADFRATVEIYGQRTMREATSHEDKFKLKSSTLKAKTRNTFLGSGSSANTSAFVQPILSSSGTSNFTLLGTFSFDINCPGKHMYNMSHTVHPLEGVTLMKVRKQAVDGADISFNGFLSMYQRTREGLGSWTRYWCVLDNGEMKFWRHPEDEGTKGWLVLLDLSTCCRSEGASTVTDICPYPNSFHIDVWVPKDDAPVPVAMGSDADTIASQTTITRAGIEQLRVMLAADTQPDLLKWLSVINSTSRQLCTWRNPIVQG
ncbi:unnamed protein product [Caenorhabditis sp. 36 PRJEB53466]|nr:unnamed protein product [Caenorhabditis sp. 36 PRJEB53466]